ncbi:MAG: hypothetical protein FWC80_06830 [Firmicutes bacterium]|nr:hypothetical protein [Bacillota bacterium]
MCEFEIIQITRKSEKKSREIVKKGKTVNEIYIDVESLDSFYSRVKNVLSDWDKKGWQVVTANFFSPVQSQLQYNSGAPLLPFTTNDLNSMEFIVVLQRNKEHV